MPTDKKKPKYEPKSMTMHDCHEMYQPVIAPTPAEMKLPEHWGAEPEKFMDKFKRETICGAADDSQDVELYDGTLGVTQPFVTARQRPVGQLQWNNNLGSIYNNPGTVSGVRWCSGTLISRDLFLSAGHCFDQTGGGWERPRINGTSNIISTGEIATNMHVNFDFQRRPDGTLRPEVSFPVVALVEYRLNGLDFAVVRLGGNPGDTFGWTQLATVDPAVGDMIAIIGHPAGMPKRIEAGPVTDLHGNLIGYNDIDTLGGNSGSGIVSSPAGRIVGVHTNGGCDATMTGHNHGFRISVLLAASPTLNNLANNPPTNIKKVIDDPPGGIKKAVDDPPRFKKVFDDRPPVKKAIDDPPKFKFTDDGPFKKIADDPIPKPVADPKGPFDPPKGAFDPPKGAFDPPGPFIPAGQLNFSVTPQAPFIMATPHHAAQPGVEAAGQAATLAYLQAALEQAMVQAAEIQQVLQYCQAMLNQLRGGSS